MTVELLERIALRDKTTLHIGGPARYYCGATTLDDIEAAAAFAHEKQLPLFVLGGGSNVLVDDEGFSGVVIHQLIKGIEVISEDDTSVQVRVGAGESLDDLVAYAVRRGYWGLENLSAIPGTVGATPVQNVGAYGVEIGDVITAVTVFDTNTRQLREMDRAACQFGYRDSYFKTAAGKALVVTAVTYRLSLVPRPVLHYADLVTQFADTTPSLYGIRQAIIAIRSKKFPDWNVIGTAGSFFKNPVITVAHASELQARFPLLPTYPATPGHVKVSLGFILDKVCGLKGVRDGRVGLYEQQALVLVAHEGATAVEVETFAQRIATQVYEATNISIEWEVQKIFDKKIL